MFVPLPAPPKSCSPLHFKSSCCVPLETVFSIITRLIGGDTATCSATSGGCRAIRGNREAVYGSRRACHPSKIDQVLLHFERNRKVVYISHVLGITIETQVTFFPANETQSAIHVAMKLVGTVSRALGFAVEPMIERSTKEFFAELVQECEAVVRKARELRDQLARRSILAAMMKSLSVRPSTL